MVVLKVLLNLLLPLRQYFSFKVLLSESEPLSLTMGTPLLTLWCLTYSIWKTGLPALVSCV
jgi:hypothetical protein